MTQLTQLTQLSLAYLFALGLIGGLVLLARRNQEQGWQKRRGVLLDVQSAAARDAFAARKHSPLEDVPLTHLGDLERLHQSLVSHREPQKEQHARSL
jgi:hypothetical protein